ncbi:MAG: hypothetical protein KF895_06500 [Parvibaculum sp.]|nr:hypothetical protein [Parvibaculum sp.]
MKPWAIKTSRIAQNLCGWLLVYLSVGAVIGILLERPYTDAPTCLPFVSVFGILESRCPSEAVNFLWAVVGGVPRLAILPLVLSFSLFLASISQGGHWWLNAMVWLLMSAPLLLVAYAGFLYWRRRSVWLALSPLAVLGVAIVYLGTRM